MPAAPARCLVYVRISSDPTGEELGVTRQREDCLALAALRGWEVAAVHQDNDVSAYSGRVREGFDALLRDIAAGGIVAVVAWDLTRLTRNTKDRARLLEACVKARTTITLVRGAEIDPSTPTGSLLAGILGEISGFESAQKADRQRRAIRQAVEQGRRVGGRRPFGYEADGITVRQDEAEAIRAGYRDFLQGLPYGEIARRWNAAGLPSPQLTHGRRTPDGSRVGAGQPSPWRGDSVRGVLRNPRYAGLRGYAPAPEHGRRVIAADHRAVWPAIVEEETWRAALERSNLTAGKGHGAGTPRTTMLLTGVATCGACGGGIWGGARPGTPGYRCRLRPGHLQRAAGPIDTYVSEAVLEALGAPDAARFLEDRDRPDAEALRGRRLALTSRLETLAELVGDGAMDAATYRRQVTKVRQDLAAVEAEQAAAGSVDLLGPLVHADDVRAAWDSLGTTRQREVIRFLVDVTIFPPGRGRRAFDPRTVLLIWQPRTSVEVGATFRDLLPDSVG